MVQLCDLDKSTNLIASREAQLIVDLIHPNTFSPPILAYILLP